MRVAFQKEYRSYLLRFWSTKGMHWSEVAYVVFGIRGLQFTMETPSTWHEHTRVWFTIGLGIITIAFSLPWYGKIVEDHYQSSGARYGFHFFSDLFWIHYGKDTGNSSDPKKTLTFYVPWHWDHKEHKILSEYETHPYTYILKNGEVQLRNAKIRKESRLWKRWWIPYRLYKEYIDVQFNEEVGERSGSWKGGCTGCSYDMKKGETPAETLGRMELERVFK